MKLQERSNAGQVYCAVLVSEGDGEGGGGVGEAVWIEGDGAGGKWVQLTQREQPPSKCQNRRAAQRTCATIER